VTSVSKLAPSPRPPQGSEGGPRLWTGEQAPSDAATAPSPPQPAVTGAAMDVPIDRPSRLRYGPVAAAAVVVLLLALAYWQWAPRGLQVPADTVRLATVEQGLFQDRVVVRGSAMPMLSVVLDAVDSGRVEEIGVRDGAMVKANDLLFRLSNPQRTLELLARQSDHAQQISNLATLRVSLESSRTEHQRRARDIQYEIEQAAKQQARNVSLAQQNYVSQAVVEESGDRLAKLRQSLIDENTRDKAETAIKQDSIRQMERVVASLQSGLNLMQQAIDALSVRSPVAGRLTDFRLQVGETVKTDQHIGRIDDPAHFKLSAQVDEFYLSRLKLGDSGEVRIGDQRHPVKVTRILPQVKEGRFTVEFEFSPARSGELSPGQAVDITFALGTPSPALLLPYGNFIGDSAGEWVYALSPQTQVATRRTVRLGRRNNNQVEVLSGLAAGDRVVISDYAGFGAATQLELVK